MDHRPTFEKTYPKYPFSELVRVGIAAGGWALRVLRIAKARQVEVPRAQTSDREVLVD